MLRIRKVLIMFLLSGPYILTGQTVPQLPDTLDTSQSQALRVFLDCSACDDDYIRTQITYINYVRDRMEAQVHILGTTQTTGSGGREYTFAFIGRENFAGRNDTLVYVSRQEDTPEITRAGIVSILKRGLMYYVSKTPQADLIEITYRQRPQPAAVEDKWNFWVFRTSLSGQIMAETGYEYQYWSLSFSANRITPEWMVRTSVSSSESISRQELGPMTVESESISSSYSGLVVKSLTDHWSAGIRGGGSSSSYSNMKREIYLAPAVEYNYFPYSESTRRQLRFLYTLRLSAVEYDEITYYNKTEEELAQQSLSISLEMTEAWGSLRVTGSGYQYLHDPDLYRESLSVSLSLRLFRGLSVSISGSASKIYDQISLRRGNLTDEEILLRIKQQRTEFSRYSLVSLSYTFGSIYSNVVNPRFGY